MSYPGICAKYGTEAQLVGTLSPMFVNTIADAVAHRGNGIDTTLVYLASIMGVFAARAGHRVANRQLKQMGVEREAGGRIVRAVQGALYALPVGAAIAFNIVSGTYAPKKPEGKAAPIHMRVDPPKAPAVAARPAV